MMGLWKSPYEDEPWYYNPEGYSKCGLLRCEPGLWADYETCTCPEKIEETDALTQLLDDI